MLFAKFGSNWPDGSGENDLIFKFSQYNFAISILSPIGKGCDPSFEQTGIPFTKDALWQVWLKLAKWFWKRRS